MNEIPFFLFRKSEKFTLFLTKFKIN
ncbi:MAG: hypothetical protein RL065_614, partial [Bacteroidota bacterium]